jgi:predicted ester cyclase
MDRTSDGVVAAVPGAAQALGPPCDSTEATPMTDERALRVAMDELARAHREGDTEAIERLLAPEYVQTDIWGRRQDRATWMAEYFRPLAELIRSGRFRWEAYDQREVEVRTLGDAAVATGSLHLRGIGARPSGRSWMADPDARVSGSLRFTRFWVRRDAEWRIVALHNAGWTPSTGSAGATESPVAGAPSPKVLLTRFCEEAWAGGKLAVVDEVVAPVVLVHDVRSGDFQSSPERQKDLIARWRSAFPDFRFVIDFAFEGGDKAVVRWTMAGTHVAALANESPTGKRFQIKGANIWRFENGRAVEIWNHRDDLGFLRQLGLTDWPGAKG